MNPFVRCVIPADEDPIDEPSWEQVEAAIRKMTGEEEVFSVLLFRVALSESSPETAGFQSEPWLAVHGEPGHYLVEFHETNSYNVVNPLFEDSDKEIEINACGIFDFFPRKTLVELEVALRAAKMFYEQGVKDSSLKWIIF